MLFRGALFAAIVGLTGSLAGAQDTSAIPMCETSTGLDGVLFKDAHGFIAVPVTFDMAEASPPVVTVIAGVRAPSGTLAWSAETGQTRIDYFDQGTRVYSCNAEFIAFDRDVHDLTAMAPGPCNWTFDRDVPLLTGLARAARVQPSFVEIATGKPSVADINPISNRSMYVVGHAVGTTNIVMLRDDGAVYQICPAVVEDAAAYFSANGIDEDDLCQDSSGLPLRFRAGQRAYVVLSGDGGFEVVVGDRDIADARITGPQEVEITALRPGITNVLAVRYGTGPIAECLIVVE